jgi:hypothetical protein
LADWSIELAIMEITQIIQSTPTVKLSRRGKHKNPNYQREYYLKNRKKLLNYSQEYYGVKKLLENCLSERKQGTKNGVKKKSFTGTHNIAFSNSNKEVFFWQENKKAKQIG